MNFLLISLVFLISIIISISDFPSGSLGIFLSSALVLIAVILIKKSEFDQKFIINIFLAALAVRMLLAFIIHLADIQFFFAPDALNYDLRGFEILQYYTGAGFDASAAFDRAEGTSMYYIVAFIYFLTGRDPLNIQLFNSVFGAGTVVLMYHCAHHIFKNKGVARTTAIFVAFFPSMILWTSLGLKDGLIMFLVSLCSLLTMKLNEKFNFLYIILLLIGLMGIISLRFYIFFMVVTAIIGSFILTQNLSVNKLITRIFAIIIVGFGLTYFGVIQTTQDRFKNFDSLEKAQMVRENMALEAESGFTTGTDVSTLSGLIQTLPIGIAYLMLSPFPWEMENLRQTLTLPEMLVWWVSIPFFVIGLVYTLKKNLGRSMFILIFSFMLTLSYAIFQGNVGTAYRHRAQIQIFYFIIIGVGVVVLQEHFENKRLRLYVSNRRITPLAEHPRSLR